MFHRPRDTYFDRRDGRDDGDDASLSSVIYTIYFFRMDRGAKRMALSRNLFLRSGGGASQSGTDQRHAARELFAVDASRHRIFIRVRGSGSLATPKP